MIEPTNLVAAGNTYNPCLLLLRDKGYQLSAEESGERLIWNARKGDHAFMAYSPPELLGIVILWESYKEDWNKQHPDLMGELCEHAAD